jgi:two-component system sensor histidine kinase/response regulator
MNIDNTIPAKPRLLVVDDEPTHMTALYHTLEDSGYDVTAFPSAAHALEAFHRQTFDLVLTDLQMPVMDGITFLRTAQDIDPNLVGIVMTGHGAIETAIAAMKAGAHDYILKPFKLNTILPVLARALEVRRLRLEINHLQSRVRDHMQELESANRELESFSYSVSHDLRAPLRAIHGFSNILVESYSPQLPGEAQQLLTRIVSSSERMSQLIEHLLRFSRLSKQAINKLPVKMQQLAYDVVEELQRDMLDHAMNVQIQPLPDAIGDQVLIRQVLTNLLSNAMKFTRQHPKPTIVVGSQELNGELVYFVSDNGAGFDMQHAENLFRVFHRLHDQREFEGNGVGLSLVQRIIQRHGGRIWAESAVNRGATFYFTLPHS